MNRHKIIIVCLTCSLLLNVFFLIIYLNEKSNNINLEKAILLNEYSERTKEWLKFTSVMKELLRNNDELIPISEEYSFYYGLLATPSEPVYVPKVTHNIIADYDFYDGYASFIIEFDREYKAIMNLFTSKLPSMDKDQLSDFVNDLDETYDFYLDKGVGDWEISRSGKEFDIQFEPHKEVLDEVIQELILIREKLETLE